MTTKPIHKSAMAREIAEIPGAIERLLERHDDLDQIVRRIKIKSPRTVILCGRGSSGHAGVYLRYLFETRLALLVSHAAPSIVTAYERFPNARESLFIVISQSGQSPDLVAATQAARSAGALTLAIVNDPDSPAADASELVLPIAAGAERAVAATKTVVLSMVAGARLTAMLAEEEDLQNAIAVIPHRFRSVLGCDWSEWANSVAASTATYVVGRGYSLGSAFEIALKVAETLRIPALGYSAAEFMHGPRASISSTIPLLLLRQDDQTATAIDDLVRDLSGFRHPLFVAGGEIGSLPWIAQGHPACDPILMLGPAYIAIEGAARRQGYDPDAPPHLTKVTQTT